MIRHLLVLGSVALIAVDAPGRVRVRLERASESTPRRLVVLVRVDAEGMVLGSYSGRVRFDPSQFVPDSIVVPRDANRYLNVTEAARGSVRFAGFTTSGFTGDVALRIVGHLLKATVPPDLSATLEVAGDLGGHALAKDSLIGAASLGQ